MPALSHFFPLRGNCCILGHSLQIVQKKCARKFLSELGISDKITSNKGVVGTMCGDVNILASCPGIILIDETYLQERVGIVFFYTCLEMEVF